MKDFFKENKVLILGLISAITVALYEFVGAPVTDWVVVAYAVFVAIGSYLARNLRGQWITIIGGILGAGAMLYTSYETKMPVDVWQLLITVAVNIGMAVAPPGKSRGYEHTMVIQNAKAEGERKAPTP